MDLEALKEPFEADAVEWRVGRAGKAKDGKPWAKVLAYLTNRAIMDRLDVVCGPGNWKNEFRDAPNAEPGKAVLCGISIRIDGEWVTKWDGADNTDFESTKGGLSDSMKRAAVQWGAGRYLYGLGESWAECDTANRKRDGWRYARLPEKQGGDEFWWKPPELPTWALPSPFSAKPEPAAGAIPVTDWTVCPFDRKPEPTAAQQQWYVDALRECMHKAGLEKSSEVDEVLLWIAQGEVGFDSQTVKADWRQAQAAWLWCVQKVATVPISKWMSYAMNGEPEPKKTSRQKQIA